tara:strand:+ start:2227 stop:2745 length:519 start_codon:yes stop_codon:yes gene_type:complete
MFNFTFKNGDTVELKAFKHSEFASEETHCYEASVYFNGKRVGVVSNQGHGGSDRWEGDYSVLRDLEARCKTDMPKWSLYDDEEHDTTFEIWCGQQVNRWLSYRDFKRAMKSKVAFKNPHSDDPEVIRIASFKNTKKITDRHIEFVMSDVKDAVILNLLPETDAFAMWEVCGE